MRRGMHSQQKPASVYGKSSIVVSEVTGAAAMFLHKVGQRGLSLSESALIIIVSKYCKRVFFSTHPSVIV